MTEKNFQPDLELAKNIFPAKVLSVRLQEGPTYLEFQVAMGAQNCCFITIITIFVSLGFWLMGDSILWGVLMIVVGGLMIFPMIKVNRHTKRFPFVIDLDQQKIYPDQSREISWNQVQSIQLVHKQETQSNGHGGRSTYDLYACLLKCEPSAESTIILHGYSRHQDEWIALGEYFKTILTKYLGRSILFNSVQTEEKTAELTIEIV